MDIKRYNVIHPALQGYIDYYYILTNTSELPATYLAYPSINNPVGFFQNCTVQLMPHAAIIKKEAANTFYEITVGNAALPAQVTIWPGVTEFCIVFKPLGLNHFCNTKIGHQLQHQFAATTIFTNLQSNIDCIIKGSEGIAKLEEKLLTQCYTNRELENVQQVIELLQKDERNSFDEISKILFLSYKTIYRLFYAHLGISPVHFKNVIKFRNALNKSIQPGYKNNMTKIALDSGYYDQANLINQFKKITKRTPKNFLATVTLLANKSIAWEFE